MTEIELVEAKQSSTWQNTELNPLPQYPKNPIVNLANMVSKNDFWQQD